MMDLQDRAQLRLDPLGQIGLQKKFDMQVGSFSRAGVHVHLDELHSLSRLVEFGDNVTTCRKFQQTTLKISQHSRQDRGRCPQDPRQDESIDRRQKRRQSRERRRLSRLANSRVSALPTRGQRGMKLPNNCFNEPLA
jgi:hypothetical protein